MNDPLVVDAVLFVSAFLAGVVNAVAGGGTLLTFPMLLTVVPPVVANATSTIALLPGSIAGAWGYREELRACRATAARLFWPSVVGGLIGSLLVTRLDPAIFEMLVPWLILTAAVLFSVQGPINRRLKRQKPTTEEAVPTPPTAPIIGSRTVLGLLVFQFFIAVYGGYFGAGIGILMLTALSLMGMEDIHQMNGVKTFLAATINAVTVVVFLADVSIHWHYAAVMAVAAVFGGFIGARSAKKLPAWVVRWIVIAVGFGLSGFYFLKQLSDNVG